MESSVNDVLRELYTMCLFGQEQNQLYILNREWKMRKIIVIISTTLLLACFKKENAGISGPSNPAKDSVQYKTVLSISDSGCTPFQMPNYVEAVLDAESGKIFKCNGWGGADSCTGNFEYQGFDVTDSLFYLWINFNPAIVQNYSDKSLRENYRWLWFQFYWKGGNSIEDEFLTPRTFADSLDSLEKFDYKDGKLNIEKIGHIRHT